MLDREEELLGRAENHRHRRKTLVGEDYARQKINKYAPQRSKMLDRKYSAQKEIYSAEKKNYSLYKKNARQRRKNTRQKRKMLVREEKLLGRAEKRSAEKQNAWLRRKPLGKEEVCSAEKKNARQRRRKVLGREEKRVREPKKTLVRQEKTLHIEDKCSAEKKNSSLEQQCAYQRSIALLGQSNFAPFLPFLLTWDRNMLCESICTRFTPQKLKTSARWSLFQRC